MPSLSEILTEYWAYCSPGTLLGPWQALPLDFDCRLAPLDPVPVLDRLTSLFGIADLLASEVVCEMTGRIVLASTLSGPDCRVLALRNFPNDPPFAIITPNGIVPSIPEVLRGLRDARTVGQRSQGNDRLHIVGSIEDLYVLRNAGLAATIIDDLPFNNLEALCQLPIVCAGGPPTTQERPHAGRASTSLASSGGRNATVESTHQSSIPEAALGSAAATTTIADCQEDIAPSHVDRVCEVPAGLVSPPHARWPVGLTLVAWSPSQLSRNPPRPCLHLAAALATSHQHLAFDVSDIAVWQPTLQEVQALDYCLSGDVLGLAVTALFDSSRNSLSTLEAFVAAPSESPDYCVARRRLTEHSVADTTDPARAHQLRQDFRWAIERQLVQPLREYGLSRGDPLRRTMTLIAAELTGALLEQLPFLENTSPNRSVGRQEVFKLLDLCIRLDKELRS